MANLAAYVAWTDSAGRGYVAGYRISGTTAGSVVPTGEALADVEVARSSGGHLSFKFTRAAAATADAAAAAAPGAYYGDYVSPGVPLPLMWALFPSWSVSNVSTDSPSPADHHSERSPSGGAVTVDLRGAAPPASAGGGGMLANQKLARRARRRRRLQPRCARQNRALKPPP